MRCAVVTTNSKHRPDEEEANLIPLTSGSVAEFYIEPMLPHVGDVDLMFHQSTKLAIPRGHPPPTQLPAEFYSYARVYEIIDSHLPGYVYLELRYLLTECVDNDKYNAVEYDRYIVMYLPNGCFLGYENGIRHGPAIAAVEQLQHYQLTVFTAYVVWCGLLKLLIGQHDTETTDGQTQQLLIVLSAKDVMWLVWHIVSVDIMNGWASISGDCHSHEQKLYC